jgi:sarcosine oxidase subunit alpha
MFSQNSFPSASIDLLRITDWFFPKHFDHHHLMVRYGSAINSVMQTFARKMAGLGTLPSHATQVRPPQQHTCDVLIVGLGSTGLTLATACAKAGLSVFAADEEPVVGGTTRDSLAWKAPGVIAAKWADQQLAALQSTGAQVALETCISATFDDGTIGINPTQAVWIRPTVRVFCNGRHESVSSFENNDLPGIYTERAMARALGWGVALGDHVLVCGHDEAHNLLAIALADAGVVVERLEHTERLIEALGSTTVTGAVVRDNETQKIRKISCNAIAIEALKTPAFELAGQAGVEAVVHDSQCFVPHCDEWGQTERDDVFVVGALTMRAHTLEQLQQIAALIEQRCKRGRV